MYFGTVHPPRLKDVRKIAARKRQSVDIAPVGFVVGRSRLHVDLQLHHVDGRGRSLVALVAVTAAAAVESLFACR